MDTLINLIYTEGDLEQTICKIVILIIAVEFVGLVSSYLGKIGR